MPCGKPHVKKPPELGAVFPQAQLVAGLLSTQSASIFLSSIGAFSKHQLLRDKSMNDNPVKKLLQSINKSTHSADLLDKLGEVALDRFLDNEIIKEIPIIGTVVSLLKAGDDFRAYAFAKKLTQFLQQIESVSVKDRDAFFQKHCETPEALAELGDSTLMVLDKIDHPALAQMYGRAFALMLKTPDVLGGQIVFEQHTFAIKNLNPYLLRALEMAYQNKGSYGVDMFAAQALSNYGLMSSEVRPMVIDGKTKTMVMNDRNTYGKHFYRVIVKGLPN